MSTGACIGATGSTRAAAMISGAGDQITGSAAATAGKAGVTVATGAG